MRRLPLSRQRSRRRGRVGTLAVAAPVLDVWSAFVVAEPTQSQAADGSAPGPYAVGVVTELYVDHTRPTPARAGRPALSFRTLTTTVWYPANGLPGAKPSAGVTARQPS